MDKVPGIFQCEKNISEILEQHQLPFGDILEGLEWKFQHDSASIHN